MDDDDGSQRAGPRIGIRARLAGMMALIYMVQGAWWPLLAIHLEELGLSGRARGWIFATFALAAVATPLGAGQVADRWFPTQRMLSVIYLCGSALLTVFGLGLTDRPAALFGLFLVYWLMVAPGYGLANSLAFRNLERPAQQFSGVRLWGTVGWMSVGWLVAGVLALNGGGRDPGRGVPEAFGVAAVLSILFAGYCLTLPHTPPLASAGRRGLDLREALGLARRRPLGTYLVIAFCVCLTAPFMYQIEPAYLKQRGMPLERIPMAMTINQVVEIFALATLPVIHRRLGIRGSMALGLTAWTVHFVVLACQPPLGVALAVLLLNGVGIACFMVTGQIFLDSQAPGHLRATAQALYVMVATGLGSFLGNVLAGEIVSWNGGIGPVVFAVPALINATMLGALALWFRPGPPPSAVVRPLPRPALAGAAVAAGRLAPDASDRGG